MDGQRSLFMAPPRKILIHQATDILANLPELLQMVNSEGVLEVVSAANESQSRLLWTIPRNPATDTLLFMSLICGLWDVFSQNLCLLSRLSISPFRYSQPDANNKQNNVDNNCDNPFAKGYR